MNPTALTVELLVLTSKVRPKARAWAYLLGFTVVLIGLVALFVSLLGHVSPHQQSGRSAVSTAIDAVLAVLLFGLGIRQLRPKKTAAEQHQSRVAQRLQAGGLATYFLIGAVAMLTDFTTVVFLIPATHEVAKSTDPMSVQYLALAVLVVIALLPLLVPVLGLTVLGHRADAFLAKVNGFVTKYPRQINASVCFFIGALVAYNAIKG